MIYCHICNEKLTKKKEKKHLKDHAIMKSLKALKKRDTSSSSSCEYTSLAHKRIRLDDDTKTNDVDQATNIKYLKNKTNEVASIDLNSNNDTLKEEKPIPGLDEKKHTSNNSFINKERASSDFIGSKPSVDRPAVKKSNLDPEEISLDERKRAGAELYQLYIDGNVSKELIEEIFNMLNNYLIKIGAEHCTLIPPY